MRRVQAGLLGAIEALELQIRLEELSHDGDYTTQFFFFFDPTRFSTFFFFLFSFPSCAASQHPRILSTCRAWHY